MRVGLVWLIGLVRRRRGRLLATSAGVAMAVALLASIGSFLTVSQSTMTQRTAAAVAVDWQVEAQPGADPATVLNAVRSQPGVVTAVPVDMAETPGFSAATGGTTQTTGPGIVLGLPPGYGSTFAGALRPLVGAPEGVLIAQQTASNLHVRPGDTVVVERPGLASVPVVTEGVVDIPHADTLFQRRSPRPRRSSTPPMLSRPRSTLGSATGPMSPSAIRRGSPPPRQCRRGWPCSTGCEPSRR